MSRLPKVTEFTVDSLVQALIQVQAWMKGQTDGDLCWFRGVKDAKLALLPGAYWRQNYKEIHALLQFSQEGRAFADVGELDDWRTYYLAQHNGVPTRLLDWTENFITALFFAVDGWKGDTRPCVWIVRPSQVNSLSINWAGLISPERNDEVNAWMPTKVEAGSQKVATKDGQWVYDSSKPLALYPRKNNSRMIAQQGTFTVHGTLKVPLEQWIIREAPDTHGQIICKIVFSKKVKPEVILPELAGLGLRRSTIYPDLYNFVLQMKEQHGWA